jgi:hypothetical protein
LAQKEGGVKPGREQLSGAGKRGVRESLLLVDLLQDLSGNFQSGGSLHGNRIAPFTNAEQEVCLFSAYGIQDHAHDDQRHNNDK